MIKRPSNKSGGTNASAGAFSSLGQIPDCFGIVAGGLRTVSFETYPGTGERSTLLLGLVVKLILKNY